MRQVSRIVVNCLLTNLKLQCRGFGEGMNFKIRTSRENRCKIANSRLVVHCLCNMDYIDQEMWSGNNSTSRSPNAKSRA